MLIIVRVDGGQALGIVAALAQNLALLGIAQIRQVHFVELEIAAAGIGERLHGAAIGQPEIAVELFHVRSTLRADRAAPAAKVQHAGRWDRHFRRGARVVRAGSGNARPWDARRSPPCP